MDFSTYSKLFDGKEKPLAYVDMDLLDQNIADILATTNNKNIRIGSKSIRSLPLIKYILTKHSRFNGVFCFTPSEAVFLSENGVDNILIGYPTVNKLEIKRVIKQIKSGKEIIFMIDDIKQVMLIEESGKAHNVHVPICIDIDMSLRLPFIRFGVYRSSTSSIQQLEEALRTIKQLKNVKLIGMMGYEAQIAGIPDYSEKQRLQSFLIRQLKKASLKKVKNLRKECLKTIHSNGFSLSFVNGGGTGSRHSTSDEASITEVTIGAGFLQPSLFDGFSQTTLKPALGFILEVSRHPSKHVYTCLGGGYVGSGSTGNEKLPKISHPLKAKYLSFEGAGEVQTPIFYKGNLQIGDDVFFRPSKSGELCERFSTIYGVSDGNVTHTFNTYRGDGQCFL
ncbi:alanine racemase [Bacillus carboniphilus]|uniref:Alanine racemase n=1 Tax=Bacillus carboniphilus TaxID=86663 RepID=A0ABY9JPM7_9BACI|nr:alanine racemase [Bacillus carboniphilus]WLR41362.1 alanine racemase [Bacillus carboniphilus]